MTWCYIGVENKNQAELEVRLGNYYYYYPGMENIACRFQRGNYMYVVILESKIRTSWTLGSPRQYNDIVIVVDFKKITLAQPWIVQFLYLLILDFTYLFACLIFPFVSCYFYASTFILFCSYNQIINIENKIKETS